MKRIAFKNREGKEGLSEQVTLSQDLKIVKEPATELSGGRTFQASEKTLKRGV